MTDTVGMSAVTAAPVAPAAPVPVPIEQMSREQALAKIDTLKGDKEFYNKLQKHEPDAHQRRAGLHKQAFPAPTAITSTEDVNNQEAARNAEGWNQYVSWLRQQWAVTPEQEAEIRNGVIRQEFYDWAKAKKDQMVRDRGFYRKLQDGDTAAREQWARITAMLALRPVKVA
jgi:hypothetical protein